MYFTRNKRAHDDRRSRDRGLEVEIQPEKQDFRQSYTKKGLGQKEAKD